MPILETNEPQGILQPSLYEQSGSSLGGLFRNPDFIQALASFGAGVGQANERGQGLGSAISQGGLGFSQTLRQAKNDRLREELQRARIKMGSELPSNVREYQYFEGLTPEEQAQYLGVKRADQLINRGDRIDVRNAGGGISESYDVNVNPNNDPALKAEQARQAALAAAQAGKEIAQPQVEARVDTNIKTVDDLLNHPGFESNFGKRGIIPNVPGTDAADAKTYIDQIKGSAFLTAIGEMKGSGAISEKEGDAATSAVARLSTAQSADSARKALGELKGILQASKKRASTPIQRMIPPVTVDQMGGGYAPSPAMPPQLPTANIIRYDAQGNRI